MNGKMIYAILLAVLSIFITLINSLCIYVISTSKRLLQNPPTLLIANLIAVHLIQGVIVVPLYAIDMFYINRWACDFYRFTSMLTFYGSCIGVVLLSIDRLLAIKMVTSYHVTVTRTRVIKLITVSWFYVGGLCLIPFLPLKMARPVLLTKQCNYNQPKIWSILMLVVNAFLTYIFVVFSYVLIRRKLIEMCAFLSKSTSNNQYSVNKNKLTKQMKHSSNQVTKQPTKLLSFSKTTLLVLWLVLCYAITWAPTIIYLLVQHLDLAPSFFNDKFYKSATGEMLSFTVKYVNFFDAIIAPIIYCFNHQEFRLKLKLKMKKFPIKKKSTASESDIEFRNISSLAIVQNCNASTNSVIQ